MVRSFEFRDAETVVMQVAISRNARNAQSTAHSYRVSEGYVYIGLEGAGGTGLSLKVVDGGLEANGFPLLLDNGTICSPASE